MAVPIDIEAIANQGFAPCQRAEPRAVEGTGGSSCLVRVQGNYGKDGEALRMDDRRRVRRRARNLSNMEIRWRSRAGNRAFCKAVSR